MKLNPIAITNKPANESVPKTALSICLLSATLVFWLNAACQAAPLLLQSETRNSTLEMQSTNRQNGDAFDAVVGLIKANEDIINQKYTTMPIGFPDEQRKFLEDIEKLKRDNQALMMQMYSAALKSFEAAPNKNPQATRVVFELISHKLDGGSEEIGYDPQGALEISMMMMKNGMDVPQIAYQAFRSSYALHDFQRARQMLKQIEKAGAPLNEQYLQLLSDTEKKWQREKAIRIGEENSNLPRVQLQTTAGTIVIELFEDHAPQTVANFISLVESKFYDELTFHLVRPGEFSQTGCPTGNGIGDTRYTIPCETDNPEIRHHFGGTVSMANTGQDTGNSQFIICHQPNGGYDGKFTAFGRVIQGLDVVYKLKTVDMTQGGITGKQPSKILSAQVLRKRNHTYAPTRVAKKQSNLLGGELPSLQELPNLNGGTSDR